jgi:hypothetical protein
MKVFADCHHGDLYFSLHLLFEKRLGWELYRPIGWDWFNQGFWKIGDPYPNPADTARQYLEISPGAWDQYKNLNGRPYIEDDIYHVQEPIHDYDQKAITLEKFKAMKFDVILPTYQPHDRAFEQLRNLYQPQAKVVAQMGNTGQTSHLPYVLHTAPYNPRQGQLAIYYHQELDMKLYSYISPNPQTRKMFSVVNCAPYLDIYNTYKATLTDIEMKYYGGGCPDGSLFGAKGVGEKMREANLGWSLKPQGGLGHSNMGWMASGRGLVTNMSQHRGWGGDAVALFEPGVTCWDIEGHSVQENCIGIRKMLEPEENIKYAERAKRRFHDLINYDEEEKKLRVFFERVLNG